MSIPIISVQQTAISIGSTLLLEGLNLNISHGDHIVIHGPSGSGKSTLLMALLGFYPISGGSLFYNGTPYSPDIVSQLRQNCAPVFQQALLQQGTAEDILFEPFSYHSNHMQNPTQEEIENVFATLQLSQTLLQNAFAKLSGGERQRITIARALLLKKSLFFLDEPTSALDKKSRTLALGALLQPEHTIISVSHTAHWIDACSTQLHIQDHTLINVTKEN